MSDRSKSPMGGWTDHIDPLELTIECDGGTHTIRWLAGQVMLDDHPDLEAELALAALGGELQPCLGMLDLWNEAIIDGGFLGEWIDDDLDSARLWWLRMALERMRNEGFHEFLRDLPVARANKMGRFLTRFPAPWLDRAAAHVAEHMIDDDGVVCEKAPVLVPQAVARRVRRAFVLSIGGRQIAFGAAALVPFRPTVGPGLRPEIAGVIKGRSSWARLSVDQRWLFDVWGAGQSVIDGSLVLAVDRDRATATIVDWTKTDDGFIPALREAVVGHDGDRWRVLDRSDSR